MPEHPPPAPAARPGADALRRHIDSRTWRRIRRLRVDCSGDRVTVHGVAPSYYLKQLALCAVRELLPAAEVDLRIQVRQSCAE